MRAGQDDTRAQALLQVVTRSPAALAGDGYPTPINAATIDATQAAANGRPVSVTKVQQRRPAAAAVGTGR